MASALRPYPAYKDSGEPWLGQIPSHWSMRRLKDFVENIAQPATARDESEIYVALEHIESETGRLILPADDVPFESTVKRFRANDVLFGKLRPYLAKGVLATRQGVCVSELLVLRSDDPVMRPKHLLYSLLCKPVINVINSSTFGSKMPRANWGFVGTLGFPVPPLGEQDAVDSYLDSKLVDIDRYIANQERLIALLQERKTALIHRAITRGLNPDARMKPSGVEWLGEIPEHWEMRRNGALFAQRIETGHPDLPVLVVSLHSGVTVGEEDADDPKRLIEDRSFYKRAAHGDIAYNMMRMWQGAVGMVPLDGLVSPAYVVAQPREGTDAQYFAYLFRTEFYKNEINRNSRGIVTDRNRLYWDDFKQMHSPTPPFFEQQAIVASVERGCSDIDRVVANTQREIALIKEYRTALIAAAVTGKIDVRGKGD